MASDAISQGEQGYLVLADISGFTAWMAAVGEAHRIDVSSGVPPGFALLEALLDTVASGLASRFTVEGLEGDAVFGAAPSGDLDHQGEALVADLREVYAQFVARRNEWYAENAATHECVACPLVTTLDLKIIVHEGPYVRQAVRGRGTVAGPSVNVVHRLAKNSVAETVGYRHYLLVTDAAAERLGLTDAGIAHRERYPDIGEIGGRVLELEREGFAHRGHLAQESPRR